MKRQTQFSVTDLLWTLSFLSAVIVVFVGNVATWPILLFFLTAVYRWWIEKNQRSVPAAYLRIIWMLVNSAYVFFLFGSFNGIEPGSSLLIVMVSMKLLESTTKRDLLVLIYMGFFLILTHFLFEQSIVMTLYSVLLVWLGITTLNQTNRSSPHQHTASAVKTAGKLLAQALPIALVLFILFPRVPGPFWALPSANQGQTGLSNSMEPGSISDLLQSSEVAFRVEFDGAPPVRRDLYWRGPVFDTVVGRKWTSSYTASSGDPLNAAVIPLGQAFSYEVILEAHQQHWLLALEMPDPNNLPNNTYVNRTGQVSSRNRISERTRLRFEAFTRYLMSPDLSTQQRSINTDASTTKNPKTRKMIGQWLKSTDNPSDLVNRTLQFFNQHPFTYTLSPPLLSTTSSVDDFIFNTRRGFCEHYASSFVTMMRYANIPSRVVTGYMGGEFNPMSGHLTVRQSDAHAWAEVWLDEQGWVRVDPTSAVAPERVERGIASALPEGEYLPTLIMRGGNMMAGVRQAIDALNASWNNWVLGYSKDRQWALLEKLGFDRPNVSRLIGFMTIVIAGMLAAYAFWLNKISTPKPTDQYQKIYIKFLRRLERLGVSSASHEDAEQIAQKAARRLPQYREVISEFCELYQQQRYGGSQHIDDYRQLRALFRQLPFTLFKLKPNFTR